MPSPHDQFAVPKPPDKGDGGQTKDFLTLSSRIGTNALLVIVALLIAALSFLIYSAKPVSQAKYVDTGKLQAVFLNTGQVYFGNITSLNKDFYVLGNVYYLQSNASANTKVANQNLALIKLGCELHKPYDRMVINSNEVTFWENLQGDGQVAKAVAQFKQQNPNGQKCSDAPAAATSSTSNLQNGATNKSPSN